VNFTLSGGDLMSWFRVGDMWAAYATADLFLITTNATITVRGALVMGPLPGRPENSFQVWTWLWVNRYGLSVAIRAFTGCLPALPLTRIGTENGRVAFIIALLFNYVLYRRGSSPASTGPASRCE
jgi:hypothetical protein